MRLPPALVTVLLAVACATFLACAAPRQSWSELSTPEVLVEVLPREATLEVDGRPLGTGSRAVAIPDRARRYAFRARAAGFEPLELELPGEKLAGARLGLVLRPTGLGASRTLDLDEPTGLAAASARLLREGRPGPAAEYAGRAAELAPDLPLPHRVLGEANAKLGRRKAAIQEYSQYLVLAPDAPDARAVEGAIEAARGDLTLPPGG